MTTATDDALEQEARNVLLEFLKLSSPSAVDAIRAKVAATVFTTIGRRQQTAGARDATALMYARELIDDGKQRQQYLKKALPTSAFVKALPV